KLYFALFALISSVAADVSHLSREYLPPVHHDASASASLGGPAVVNVGFSAGSSAAPSGTATYTSHHQSFESVHQPQPQSDVSFTFSRDEAQAAEPAAPVAPADDGAVSSVSFTIDGAQQQYHDDKHGQQQVHFGVESEGADVGVVGGVGAGDAGVAYGGSYDLSSQDGGVQDLEHNSLVSDDYGSNAAVDNEAAHVSHAAAQGPAVRAPQSTPADVGTQDAVVQYVSGGESASTGGIETQYGANGGYIY
ncbi:uncharacterized protein LOC118753197, partial [Rhagoletis pomonella]|uniref:uncharacterized protein LOC118753197 n=1 Tax=Rhagoletis pomonella TaxID=28610 RepID=UPI00177DE7EE